MTDDNLPKAVWEGEIAIGGLAVKCVVLDDGRRIIDAESFDQLLALLATGPDATATEADALKAMAAFCSGRGIPQ